MAFLIPHLPEFEGELKDLLIEIDKLIDKKRVHWENEIRKIEQKLSEKIVENEELQKRISEMKPTSKIEMELNSGDCGNHCSIELDLLKTKVDKMSEGYDILKQKYHKQLTFREKEHLTAIRALKEEKMVLKNDTDNLKKQSFTELEMLKSKLAEERENSCRLAEHCKDIQFRLDSMLNEYSNHQSRIDTINADHHKLEKQLRSQLIERDRLINSQDLEINQLQQALSEKQIYINRLSSQTISCESELLASKQVVQRLGKVISRHIAIVSGTTTDSAQQSTVSSARSSPDFQDDMCHTPEELNRKLNLFESQLINAQAKLIEKLDQVHRLETACQTASVTIQRLVKARRRHTDQVAVVTALLQGSKATAGQLVTRVSDMEKTFVSELVRANEKFSLLCERLKSQPIDGERIEKVAVSASAIQTEAVGDTSNRSVQTDGRSPIGSPTLIPINQFHRLERRFKLTVSQLEEKVEKLNRERTDLEQRLSHQMSLVEKLQEENLAISDLLTEAESFNRTRISCATGLQQHQRLSTPGRPTPVAVRRHPESVPQGESPVGRMPEYGPVRTGRSANLFLQPLDDGSPETPTVTSLPGKSESQFSSPSSNLQSPQDDFGSQDHLSDSLNQKIPQVSPRHRILNPQGSQSPVIVESDRYPQIEPDCSPMTSPSEYDDFALKLPNISSHIWRDNSPQCPSSFGQQLHSREEEARSSLDNRSPLRQPRHESVSAGGGFGKDPMDLAAESADLDDTSIFSLAAKFLADEQQHSAILEQRIDAHLDALKSRVASLANPLASFNQ